MDMSAVKHLVFVHPTELQAFWDYVRPRLEIVSRRSKARWIPEDIYHALKAQTATLHIGEIGDEYVGLVVLAPSLDFDGQTLTIWACYSEENHDVIELYEPEIVGFAKRIKAKRLVFNSPRKGWGRRLKPHGYRPVSQCYEKEV
jgi:hypothetical protein